MIDDPSELEVWKPIKNYIDRYEVSNFGRVRSIGRIKHCKNQFTDFYVTIPCKYLKEHIGPDKYCRVTLTSDGGVRKTFLVHRLVAQEFIQNPNSLPEVNHLDRNHANNVASNLEWCTKLENMHHAHANGFDPGVSNRGKQFSKTHRDNISKALKGRELSDDWQTKLKTSHIHQQKCVMCIEDGLKFNSYKSASDHYCVNSSTISDSVRYNRKIKKLNKSFVQISYAEFIEGGGTT